MNDEHESKEQLDWTEAEAYLREVEQAYGEIGIAGAFALAAVINPCRVRFNAGERSQELFDEIMEISL